MLCRSHGLPMLFPCHSTKALDCVFPIWFTQCGHVWFTHSMSFPCHATNMPIRKWTLKAMADSWHVRGRVTACWRYVGDLPLLVPGSLLSEAYQSQMQVASVKQSTLGEWQGNGMVCVNPPLDGQGTPETCRDTKIKKLNKVTSSWLLAICCK
jgi:hypothetical protein